MTWEKSARGLCVENVGWRDGGLELLNVGHHGGFGVGRRGAGMLGLIGDVDAWLRRLLLLRLVSSSLC